MKWINDLMLFHHNFNRFLQVHVQLIVIVTKRRLALMESVSIHANEEPATKIWRRSAQLKTIR